MMLFKYDENGIYVCPIILEDVGGNEDLSSTTEVEPPFHLHRAKWNGSEWIEDMTQEEIDALNNQPKEPTEIEKQQETINTLGRELAQLKLQFMMGGM